ncbi:MAG TPA: type II toxin-antitoxin system VapC family toxin [Acidobacteriota bacterium]|nr:type II toxin-antitoxin system VapC family toxin [Acidobacteriota bacterium]
MSLYFFDISALVKRYLIEPGSGWVISITDPGAGHAIYVGEITQVEAAAAMAARHRAPGGITLKERDDAVDLLGYHFINEYQPVAIGPLILDQAIQLTQNYRLRGYDAVQLATAIVTNTVLLAGGIGSLTFVTADSDLIIAGRAEGLLTDDPNLYP